VFTCNRRIKPPPQSCLANAPPFSIESFCVWRLEVCHTFPDGLSSRHSRPSASSGFPHRSLPSPDVGANEQLSDGSAGGEGASDAICVREGGGAVVCAASCAGAAVVTSAGAREERQGAGRAAEEAAGEGQSDDLPPLNSSSSLIPENYICITAIFTLISVL